MAIYEYYSPDNKRIYSFYAKSISQSDKLPRCPDNPKYKMIKMISNFSVTENKPNSESVTELMSNDSRNHVLQRTMNEIESDMTGIDEENPNPRKLGQLMRKIAEISGRGISEEMEELMRSMEAGEDPDELEEKFENMCEDEEILTEDNTENIKCSKFKNYTKQLFTRDTKLYDFSDYL